ncbi:MAG: hypothetical protein FWG04_05025 [Desulfovibrionaceae bacterium]|nr:hypothetical protein [Desulfovibrionaceae bacterium]
MIRPLFRALGCLVLAFALISCGDAAPPAELNLHVENDRTSFVDFGFYAKATITATARERGKPVTISPGDITWTVENSSITAPWWSNRNPGAMNGLRWGDSPISLTGSEAERMDMSGNGAAAPKGVVAYLTDIVGSRTVTVKAAMTIAGERRETAVRVTFGPGPLSVFAGAPKGAYSWADAARACGGTPGIPKQQKYQPATKLPTSEQLQHVAGPGEGGKQGAAHAAGWPEDRFGIGRFIYWTGVSHGSDDRAKAVALNDGDYRWTDVIVNVPLAVCLP